MCPWSLLRVSWSSVDRSKLMDKLDTPRLAGLWTAELASGQALTARFVAHCLSGLQPICLDRLSGWQADETGTSGFGADDTQPSVSGKAVVIQGAGWQQVAARQGLPGAQAHVNSDSKDVLVLVQARLALAVLEAGAEQVALMCSGTLHHRLLQLEVRRLLLVAFTKPTAGAWTGCAASVSTVS